MLFVHQSDVIMMLQLNSEDFVGSATPIIAMAIRSESRKRARPTDSLQNVWRQLHD